MNARLLAAVLLSAAFGTSCGEASFDEGLALGAPETVAVDLEVGDGKLQLIGLGQKDSALTAAPDAERRLYYELRGPDGLLLASGDAPDTRALRYEVQDETGTTGGEANASTVVTVELPEQGGELVVYEEVLDGGLSVLGRVAVPNANELPLTQSLLAPWDIVGSPVQVYGQKSDPIDVLIVAEGYTEGELGTFRAAVKAIADGMVQRPDYGRYAQHISIRRLDVKSRQSGIDDPEAGISVKTAFNVSYGTSVRRCIASDGLGKLALKTLKLRYGAKMIAVLVNMKEHGGCATSGLSYFSSSSQDPWNVLAHELGHSMLGLADEYEYGGSASSCAPRTSSSSPNVSVSSTLSQLPWKDLVRSYTSLPTPETTSYSSTVGAFLGAQYCDKNRWRPQLNCMMRSSATPMCAVCSRELDRFIAKHTGQ